MYKINKMTKNLKSVQIPEYGVTQPHIESMPRTNEEIGMGYSGRFEIGNQDIATVSVEVRAGKEEGGNEDRFSINPEDGIYGVFDGASGLTSLNENARETLGLTGGAVASSILAVVMAKPSNQSLRERILSANQRIGAAFEEFVTDSNEVTDRFCTTAGVVRVKEGQIEIVCIADTPVILIKSDGTFEMPVANFDQDVESLRLLDSLVMGEGLSHDEAMGDPRMKAQLLKKRGEQNQTYGVLNGQAEVEGHIRTASVSSEGVESILIFSDGLIPPAQPGEEPDWQLVVDAYIRGGEAEVLSTIRGIEDADPDCIAYPRFKKHDDSAILGIRLQ